MGDPDSAPAAKVVKSDNADSIASQLPHEERSVFVHIAINYYIINDYVMKILCYCYYADIISLIIFT